MSTARRTYMGLAGTLVLVALVVQLYLIITVNIANGSTAMIAVIRFFTFFTILANVLVMVALLAPLAGNRFFARPTVIAAIVVYIVIVGVTYSLVLRELVTLTGLQAVVDRVLHDIMPIAFVLYWLVFVPKGTLRWRDLGPWLPFPFVYLLVVLALGASSGWYPYPFIDVSALGYPRMLVNAAVVTAAVVIVGLAVIGIDRLVRRQVPG